MSSQPSTPAAPAPPEAAVVAEREVVVWIGWRIERTSAALRAVPDLVRGQPDWLDADVRYAVLLTAAWCAAGGDAGRVGGSERETVR